MMTRAAVLYGGMHGGSPAAASRYVSDSGALLLV
jgi:hypothetical protein